MRTAKSRSAFLLLAVCLLASPSAAVSFTLDDLVNGSVPSFQSGNGQLTFSNFAITKLKKLSGDLSLYTVTVVDDGFVLSSSAFTANSGGLKRLNLTYEVTANGGLITGASMEMDATRSTGRVMVQKDIDDPASDEGTFLSTLLTSSRTLLDDSDTFSPGAVSFEVEEAIRIKKVSALNSVRNSYTVVPEPPVLSLLAVGLSGLAWLGRRRGSPDGR